MDDKHCNKEKACESYGKAAYVQYKIALMLSHIAECISKKVFQHRVICLILNWDFHNKDRNYYKVLHKDTDSGSSGKKSSDATNSFLIRLYQKCLTLIRSIYVHQPYQA
jgi:hypothetical protein